MAKRSIRFIKERIKSIKNIQKLTRAMMLIASCKLIKAERDLKKARPYALRAEEIINDIATRAEKKHPFLIERNPLKELIIIISSERGLCGSFNTNVLKEADNLLKQSRLEVSLLTIGKKASLYFRKTSKIIKEYPLPEKEPMKFAEELAEYIKESYILRNFDKISFLYNEFISIFYQKPKHLELLPFIPPLKKRSVTDYIYEPDYETCLNKIFSIYFRSQIKRIFLESLAAEYASRMLAMENATKNAENLIKELFLIYNQLRQATITKEITEITSTSEALQ